MDPGTGKAKSVPLGSINRSSLAVSEKLSGNCSKRELEEIQAWVERYRSIDDLKRKVAALTLAEQIAAAIDWFTEATPEDAGQIAADVLAATAALRSVLMKRGLA